LPSGIKKATVLSHESMIDIIVGLIRLDKTQPWTTVISDSKTIV
jgi:hypothetical protein